MIKTIKTLDGFKELESDWKQLYESSPRMTPFQSFTYNYLAWTRFCAEDGALCIIVSISNTTNQINGIFPCFIDRRHMLRFINDRHTDFCNAIIDSQSFGYSSYEELSDFLKKESAIKIVHFANLEYYNGLKSSFKPFFNNIYTFEENAYSRLMITPCEKDKDFVDSLLDLNAKKRKKLRAKLQSESELEFDLRSVSKGGVFPQSEICELREIMISKGERTPDYLSDRMLTFWYEMYQSGILVIALLYKEGIICSVNLMFFDRQKNEYIKWIILYRDKKYNLIANIKLIEVLYNEGGASLNFARGIYDYKMVNFHPIVYNLYSLYIAKTPIQSFKVLALLNWHYIKMIVKSIIRK